MITKNTKKIKILKKSHYESSRILNIFVDEHGEEHVEYEIYFQADLRNAINKKIFNCSTTLRKNMPRKKVSFLSDLSDKSPLGVTASLYKKQRQNKKNLSIENNKGILARKNTDLTYLIDNRKINNMLSLSDKRLFGSIKETKIVSVGSIVKNGKDIIVSQKDLSNIDPTKINSYTHAESYEKLITKGSDPGILEMSLNSLTAADQRSNGSIIDNSLNQNSSDYSLRLGIFKKVSDSKRKERSNNISSYEKNKKIAVTSTRVNRVKIVPVRLTLKLRDIGTLSKIYAEISMVNKKNIIVQTIYIEINHSENLSNYYIPRNVFNISSFSSFSSYKKPITINVFDGPERNRYGGLIVSQRKINKTSELINCKWKDIVRRSQDDLRGENKNLKNARSSKIDFNSLKLGKNSLDYPNIDMFRILTIGKTGDVYGNFNSSVIKNKNFILENCSIYTTPIEEGIKLQIVGNVSRSIVGITFLRRDITVSKRGVFKNIYDNAPEEMISSPIDGKVNSRTSIKGFTTIDRTAIEGRVYEYRASLRLYCGTTIKSKSVRVEKYLKPLNSFSPKIENKKYELVNSGKNSFIEIPSSSTIARITFNLSYNMPASDSSSVIELLQKSGLDDIYNDDIEKIKKKIDNLVVFKVTRFNVITGITYFLGYFSKGEFKDDGESTSGPAPVPGQKYIYRAEACLVSPPEIIEDLKNDETDISNTPSISAVRLIRDPGKISSIRTFSLNKKIASSNLQASVIASDRSNMTKSFSKSAFSKGTLSPNIKKSSSPQEKLGDYSTGDFQDIEITTGKIFFDISPSVPKMGGHNGAVLRWSITSGEKTQKDIIDYFIVIAEKQGKFYPCGSCHGGGMTSFAFIDYTSIGYVGIIDYSIVPVLIDGTVLENQRIGSISQMSFQKTFRKTV